MSFDLNFHIHRLLKREPFFACFSRRVEKIATETIPTAAIAYDKGIHRFTLLYNPGFFESMTDEHKVGILKHEFYHLIFGHLNARMPFDFSTEPENIKPWNVATDLAINSHIAGELPEMTLVPGRGDYEGYLSHQTAEAYYRQLMKDKEDRSGPYANPRGEEGEPDSMDDHSGWGRGEDDFSSKVAEEKLKEFTKEAVDNVEKTNNWGSVPYEVRRRIKESIVSTISPERVLQYFIKTSTKSSRVSTVRRINPRYPYIHPGRKAKRTANIAISIDQSGSVADEMLQIFFSFLNKFAALATFTVVPFDSTVCTEGVYVWKKGETRKWERVRYGGTNFDAPTKWVNSRNFDGHIIITDMQAPQPVASKCQRLWITNSYNKNYPYFQTNEKVLAIDA